MSAEIHVDDNAWTTPTLQEGNHHIVDDFLACWHFTNCWPLHQMLQTTGATCTFERLSLVALSGLQRRLQSLFGGAFCSCGGKSLNGDHQAKANNAEW